MFSKSQRWRTSASQISLKGSCHWQAQHGRPKCHLERLTTKFSLARSLESQKKPLGRPWSCSGNHGSEWVVSCGKSKSTVTLYREFGPRRMDTIWGLLKQPLTSIGFRKFDWTWCFFRIMTLYWCGCTVFYFCLWWGNMEMRWPPFWFWNLAQWGPCLAGLWKRLKHIWSIFARATCRNIGKLRNNLNNHSVIFFSQLK